MQEKFSITQVARLRGDLLKSDLDFFELAETIKVFLARNGYGISSETAREVVAQLDWNVESFRSQLETVALAM